MSIDFVVQICLFLPVYFFFQIVSRQDLLSMHEYSWLLVILFFLVRSFSLV